MIAILEKIAPGIREEIEAIDASTPATVIRYTGNWQGSMEGWLLTPQTGFKPLPRTLPGLKRFMMVGQWVMPGGGLPSGLMTARSALQEICKQDRWRFPGGPIAEQHGELPSRHRSGPALEAQSNSRVAAGPGSVVAASYLEGAAYGAGHNSHTRREHRTRR